MWLVIILYALYYNPLCVCVCILYTFVESKLDTLCFISYNIPSSADGSFLIAGHINYVLTEAELKITRDMPTS